MENSSSVSYPTRPQAKNCLFFGISGICRYGENCRFNHPVQVDDDTEVDHDGGNQNVYANSTLNIPCKFFIAGNCKYGPYCRFYHPSPVAATAPDFAVQYNSHGLPMRMGVAVCSFYMKAGWCGYGETCKFHHPELMEIGSTNELYGAYAGAEAGYPYARGYTTWY